MKFPRSILTALLWIVFVRIFLRVRGLGFRRRDSSEIAAHQLTRVDICCSVAFSLAVADTIRGAAFQARHLLLALRAGEPYRVARALSYEVGYLGTRGREAWPRVQEVLEVAKQISVEAAHPQVDALTLGNEGLANYLNGRFATGLGLLDDAREIFVTRCKGSAWEIDTMQVFALNCYAQLGRLKELCEKAPRYLRESVDRGDIYGAVGLRVGFPNLRWLVQDDVDGCRREIVEAMAQWSKQGFHLEHFYALMAETQADLYGGQGVQAHERVARALVPIRKSLLPRVQSIRILAAHLGARAAIAAAEAKPGEAEPLLRLAERGARRLDDERIAWATPLAHLVRASVAHLRGSPEVLENLRAAAAGFDEADMGLHACVARRCLGKVTGGDEGALLVRSADEWMVAQGVRDTAKVTAMIAPGLVKAS